MKTQSFFVALLLASAPACGPTSPGIQQPPSPANKTGTGGGQAGARDQDETGNDGGLDPEKLIGKDASLLRAKFKAEIRAAGIKACLGEIIFRIKADFKPKTGDQAAQLFDIEDGKVSCPGLGVFDVKQMMGAFASAEPPPNVADPVVVKNDVISFKAMSYGLYQPPRPLLPSFLAASPEALRTLDVATDTSINDVKNNKQATGHVRVRTLDFGQPWTPPGMTYRFANVLHFEVVNEGFAGIDKIGNFLFDRMEFRISLNPVAILSISFTGKAADYKKAAQGAGGGTAGGILGNLGGSGGQSNGLEKIIDAIAQVITVKMDLTLMDQGGLDESKPAEEPDGGPVIGGGNQADDD